MARCQASRPAAVLRWSKSVVGRGIGHDQIIGTPDEGKLENSAGGEPQGIYPEARLSRDTRRRYQTQPLAQSLAMLQARFAWRQRTPLQRVARQTLSQCSLTPPTRSSILRGWMSSTSTTEITQALAKTPKMMLSGMARSRIAPKPQSAKPPQLMLTKFISP